MNRLAHILTLMMLVPVLPLGSFGKARGMAWSSSSLTSVVRTMAQDGRVLYHAVERGETLSSIARKYNVSLDDILSVNSNLSRDKISPGMIILIPEKGTKVNKTKQETQREQPVKEEKRGIKAEESRPQKPVEPVRSERIEHSVPESTLPVPTKGLKPYVVPSGQTIYNLCKITGWSEEQLLYYNPQVKHGLRAGMTILIPQEIQVDSIAPHLPTPEKGKDSFRGIFTPVVPTMPALKIVLALPFSTDSGNRFSDYYEGFLLALKETQEAGNSVDLYVYDCSPANMRTTINEIDKLTSVDYIIGGVSDESIKLLASAAELKGAAYIIPFTSKNYPLVDVKNVNVFQVNTPHDVMHEVAAARFVREHQGDHVCIVRSDEMTNHKEAFISTLKSHMNRGGISYEELNIGAMMLTKSDVQRLSQNYSRTVMIPTSGSLVAATGVLAPITHAMDSLAVNNVTAFGYPEWQTYYAIVPQLSKVGATFYTPFYADTKASAYKAFQREFVTWFSHSIGNTYPKYSVLGYDTGRYFLFKRPEEAHGTAQESGLQSQFDFMADEKNTRRFNNHGVIFVQYNSDGTVEGR